jgi:hypothetical protein
LKDQGILRIPSPVSAKKATGIAEKSNDLLQRILKKIRVSRDKWPLNVQNATFELNRREIIHLGHTLYEILFGYQPASKTELAFPTVNQAGLALMLTEEWLDKMTCDNGLDKRIFDFMAIREETCQKIQHKSDYSKEL